jgi:hypothetical protein
VTDSAVVSGASGESSTHSPYRRATDLLQRLAPGKMRIGFLLGAGCPLAIRVDDGSGKKPLIPDIAGLTEQVKQFLSMDENLKAVANEVWNRVSLRGIAVPTIEHVLSHIRTLASLCHEDGSIDGFSRKSLVDLDQSICKKVKEVVNQTLPTGDAPYHALASWIQAISREKPVEIFTTNYDLITGTSIREAQAKSDSRNSKGIDRFHASNHALRTRTK